MQPTLNLRDIHLPPPVGLWPPAPGWWLLLIVTPLLLAGLVWLLRRLRRQTAKKLALRELDAIRHAADAQQQIQAIAILLRRAAISVYPRQHVASLTGDDWLAFLDSVLQGDDFRRGAGRLLLDAPYRRNVTADLQPLLALSRRWLNALPAQVQTQIPERQP